MVGLGSFSGIHVHHRPVEPAGAQERAELRRAISGSRRSVRGGRLRTQGQHVHSRLRRRVLGLARVLGRLRRSARALVVPVADGAASEEDAFRATDLVRVRIDAQVRLDVLTGGEDHEPTRPVHGVGPEMAGRKADEVTRRERPFSRGLAKHRCARDHVEPLLDPEVVVVRPDRHARLGFIDARADPLSLKPETHRGRDVTEAGFVERLVQLDAEKVHLSEAHA